ncbi:MAG: hypothetical protein ACXABO_16235 [Promethearchaeota archaeon]|jgi:hypothetical protein
MSYLKAKELYIYCTDYKSINDAEGEDYIELDIELTKKFEFDHGFELERYKELSIYKEKEFNTDFNQIGSLLMNIFVYFFLLNKGKTVSLDFLRKETKIPENKLQSAIEELLLFGLISKNKNGTFHL